MNALRHYLSGALPKDSTVRWILSGFAKSPFLFPFALLRSVIASRQLTGSWFPIKVRIAPRQSLFVRRGKNSYVRIDSFLKVVAWGGDFSNSSISVGEGASISVHGPFEIGPGVHLSVGKNAELVVMGRKHSSGSGITSKSRVMVERSVHIGADTIIAWDVLVTDSDWHQVIGTERISPVQIGDHVWIAHGVSILKGANIPDGCVVGAKSMVSRGHYSPHSLLAGVPAKMIKGNMEWTR